MSTASELARSTGELLIAGFDGTEPSAEILELIRAGLGGVILFRKNCLGAAQVLELTNRLQEAARAAGHERPLLIAIDQEQGRVVRIVEGVTLFPAMGVVARAGDPSLIERVAEAIGRELLAVGVNWNLAPVADVLSVPDCPVGDRSFGADPAAVAALVAAYVRGAGRAGILTSAKHFPGHGATRKDSHFTTPTVGRSRAELERGDLVPFRAAIAAGVSSVMTTHITFPALDATAPATISPVVLGDLLRGALGFEGVVISDDLEMAGIALKAPLPTGARAALRAGCDILIVSRMLLPERDIPGLLAALREAIGDGGIPLSRTEDALKRVRRLREGLSWRADPGAASAVLRAPTHLTLLDEVHRRAGA
ncbi:MAG TPA: beta-N-acetylhexosaminidase [Candidatus Methanoperedens sp.]|nr:beta-N-acetylhexosaminidase [Candidatus Methanoperedens sp.]